MPTPTYDLISEQVLGSSASSVTFSSIPGTYKDLVLEICGAASTNTNTDIFYNGDTNTGNYSRTYIYGDGTVAASGRAAPNPAAGNISTSISHVIVNMQSYSNSNIFKTSLSRAAQTGVLAAAYVVLWRNTNAITSFSANTGSGTFNAGCTFRLWGVAG